MNTLERWAIAAAASALLAACGDTSTSQRTVRKADTPPWQGADNPYVQGDWKAGDAASWEQQMRNRAQAQNEYSRVSGG